MDNTTINGTNNPGIEPVTGAVGPTKAPKLKAGLIIGIIAGIVAIVGIAVAVVVLANSSQKNDAFDLAIQKMFNQEETRNAKIAGTVHIDIPDSSAGISEVNLNVESQVAQASLMNYTKASTDLKFSGGQSIRPEVETIYADSGDIFIRLGGLASSISTIAGTPYESLPKEIPFVKLIDSVDAKWIHTSTEEIEELMTSGNNGVTKIEDRTVRCLSNFASGLTQNTYSLSELYKSHPFITSTQKDLAITKKANPLYKVIIDRDNLVAFNKDFNKTDVVQGFLSCVSASATSSDDEVIDKMISVLPETYVEIDGNHDITRLYFEFDPEVLGVEITSDFDYSHPNTVSIVEPTEYQELSDILELFTESMSGMGL